MIEVVTTKYLSSYINLESAKVQEEFSGIMYYVCRFYFEEAAKDQTMCVDKAWYEPLIYFTNGAARVRSL